MQGQLSLFTDNSEYDAFVDKFKPQKTTDDCYTPPEVYETIKDWACKEYVIDPNCIVRPFWPGGDYESFDYPDGCVVLDNPPFSILSKICAFYLDRGISFFLFAPSLTVLSAKSITMRMNHIICDCDIVYENGAKVRTSFVTSFGRDIILQSCPELTRLINDIVNRLRREQTKQLPKYIYPAHVVTAAMVQKYSKYGINFQVRRGECALVSELDSQRESGKTIFGSGLLLSDRAAADRAASDRVAADRAAADRVAADRAAADRAAAKIWELSDREKAIVAGLSDREKI